MVARAIALAVLVCASAASATEGEGRVTVEAGWRFTPNDFFYGSAEKAGFPRERGSIGGPQVAGSFGYFAKDAIEVSIDLLAGAEQLHLVDRPAFTSITYGALVGARFHLTLFEPVTLYFGVQGGPTLVNLSGGNIEVTEELVSAFQGSVGVGVRLTPEFGVSLEYRYLLARGYVPGIGGVNGGGSWFGIGFTWYVAGQGARPDPRM